MDVEGSDRCVIKCAVVVFSGETEENNQKSVRIVDVTRETERVSLLSTHYSHVYLVPSLELNRVLKYISLCECRIIRSLIVNYGRTQHKRHFVKTCNNIKMQK